ncbi:MAG: pyridoxamine 5'-phosphate oxidase family protein [Verrucomicrobia bacterium]|nr:pyridoxamine 5'-phosphate oxidase family protein [Verrucomicrobiota bacterium]
MTDRYLEIATSDTVKLLQERWGSRSSYCRLETGPLINNQLGPEEIAFIEAQDSFFLASVNDGGWPYIQHRGGRPRLLKVLGNNQLGFPDFKGNRQYLSFGNILKNPRISLFLIDYPARARLKIFGQAELVEGDDLPAALRKIESDPGATPIERGIIVQVEAFHWNCPKYIVARFTADQVRSIIDPLVQRIKDLEAELARFSAKP